jgi:oxygen-independent coproporphyrinogen-3 oxidase
MGEGAAAATTAAAASARSVLPEARMDDRAGEGLPADGASPDGSPAEGLYVHFPLCVSLCPYCDFVVFAGAAARGPGNRITAIFEALLTELDLRAALLPSDRRPPLASVYLGGGTPSLLTADQVGRLLDRIRVRLGLADDAEVTLEANPGADEVGDLAAFRAAGVTRLSIGAQSLDGSELRRLGRRHRPSDVVAAMSGARRAGFASISLDLLADVPGQSLGSWRRTLSMALDLGPDHLSVYSLTLDDPDADGLTGPLGDHLPLRGGARAWRQRARAEQSDERAAEMELVTDELAATAGLVRYEIANLARPGHESRHNLLYWQRRPHLAIGPGAHAFDGARTRSWNAALLAPYVAALRAGRLPPGDREVVDEATALAETAMLGLRLVEGIDAALASHPELRPALDWARSHGLAEDRAGRTCLTQPGRLVANEVFERLLPAAPRDRPSSRAHAPVVAGA